MPWFEARPRFWSAETGWGGGVLGRCRSPTAGCHCDNTGARADWARARRPLRAAASLWSSGQETTQCTSDAPGLLSRALRRQWGLALACRGCYTNRQRNYGAGAQAAGIAGVISSDEAIMRGLFAILVLLGIAGIVLGVVTIIRGMQGPAGGPFSFENYGGPGPIIAGLIVLAVS